jgi:putative endonuclease
LLGKQELGQEGENLAAEFLVSQGFALLGRNVRSRLGEIDILAQQGDETVLVEVKTLSSARGFDPITQINPAKQRKLRLLAREVAARYPDANIRIDAVTVYWGSTDLPVITHFPNILF